MAAVRTERSYMTEELTSKRNALVSIGGMGLPPLIVVVVMAVKMPSSTPIALLLPFPAIYALVAFTACLVLAAGSERRMIRADILRIICWTVLAAGEGLREKGFGWFALGWPEYVQLVDALSLSIIVVALGLIVVSLFLWPPAPVRTLRAHPSEGDSCEHNNLGQSPIYGNAGEGGDVQGRDDEG